MPSIFTHRKKALLDVRPAKKDKSIQDIKTPLMMMTMSKSTKEKHENANDEVCLRDWNRSLAWRDDEFALDGKHKSHPHVQRRINILKKYPMVRKLFGPDYRVVPIILLAALNQILLSWLIGSVESNFKNNLFLLVTACVVGASLVDMLSIAVHECCHTLASGNVLGDKILGLVCNIGTPVPIAMSFRRYHTDHHAFQGSPERDPDIPLNWEIKLIKGSAWKKVLWLLTYPIMYAFRATVRGKTVNEWEVVNLVFTITTNVAVVYFLGWRAFLYQVISFFYGFTFHPAASHFLQEHYTFDDGQETYNYHGKANLLFLNIGFHNEHHDFPSVACLRLPFLTKIAPEFYNPLVSYNSWTRFLYSFITDTNIGPQSRVVRKETIEDLDSR